MAVVICAVVDRFIVVLVTVGSSEEARQLAHALVQERLAACVNRLKGIESVYRWLGNVEESEEDLLIIKTTEDLFERLKSRIRELHSYSVPEIIALPILHGNEDYLSWLGEQVSPEQK